MFTLEYDTGYSGVQEWGPSVCTVARVFVGIRALILPGVTPGEGAVVGAGAVVTGDMSPFTIVAGMPAQPVGRRRQDLACTLGYRKFLG